MQVAKLWNAPLRTGNREAYIYRLPRMDKSSSRYDPLNFLLSILGWEGDSVWRAHLELPKLLLL